ncbi:MAG: family NAD(P)-dependent oxidoreductase [Deltaproteobacteria bacterium]|nr:family NAD(P)-dependent oxidoreductase [Deltaproteobacteria bacterium]
MERSDVGQTSFRDRYGPWAVVAGASEGIGESFARQLAAQGLGLVLLARRQGPLDALAKHLRAANVPVRTAAIDLTRADLVDQVRQVTDDLAVGLLVYNAGATHGANVFLGRPVEHGLSLMHLNCRGPLLLTHHFGTRMAERGRGGIVLVTSMSAVAGCARNAVYSAAKAFELIFAEGLWAELQPRGVDVMACVAGATRTPSLINTGARFEGGAFSIMESDDVAAEALAHIADGPMWVVGEDNRRIAKWFWPTPRAQLIRALSASTAAMWD